MNFLSSKSDSCKYKAILVRYRELLKKLKLNAFDMSVRGKWQKKLKTGNGKLKTVFSFMRLVANVSSQKNYEL